MRRRDFIKVVAGSAMTWPLVARAKQPMPVIGFLNGGSSGEFAPMVAAFRQGLREAGYVEGQNVAIEFRWAEGKNDPLPALVADLVAGQVAVIAATSSPAALPAKAATTTIPIVFEGGFDPVEVGLVASLSRPGGNVTGITNFSAVLAAKVLELADELLANPTVIAVLVNPTSLTRAESTGRALGKQIHILNASTEGEIDAAFASLAQLRAAHFGRRPAPAVLLHNPGPDYLVERFDPSCSLWVAIRPQVGGAACHYRPLASTSEKLRIARAEVGRNYPDR